MLCYAFNMKINTLRRIDYYLGPTICRIILAFRWLVGIGHFDFTNGPLIEECKNVLIIKFFGMGTILLSSPSLRALKKRYPFARITILTLPTNRELCEMLPSINDVLCLSIKNPFEFLTSFFNFLSIIEKKKFDIIIDLEFLTNFSAMVTLFASILARPKLTIGFNSPLKWRNGTHDINVSFDHSRHITKIFEKIVLSLNVKTFDASFEPEKKSLIGNMSAGYMDKIFRTNPALHECTFFTCVNINAGELSLHRRWPKEYFAEVINELVKKPGVAILLIGGKEDIDYVSEFKKLLPPSPQIVNLCGKTDTIKDLIGLFKRCDLLITNDSGPLHLAYIVGLSTISFFGPETPYLYGPTQNGHRVFYEELYCSPCLNIYNSKTSHCKKNMCLISIKPEAVLKVIENDYINKNRTGEEPAQCNL